MWKRLSKMSKSVANWFVLLTVIVLILLSIQAEPVTATLGFIVAAFFSLALIVTVVKGK
jgi:hypothetical protein